MAASVLGKRKAQAILVPTQARKRRTRASLPKIHKDEANYHQTASTQHGSPSTAAEDPGACIQTSLDLPLSKSLQQDAIELCFTSKAVPDLGECNLGTITDENTPPGFFTPTRRYRDALSTKIPITPSRRLRLVSTPLTPRTPWSCISQKTERNSTYAEAKALFSQSAGSLKIVGRDRERVQITTFISQAMTAKRGGCIYISGPPGTGKSALTREVFDETQLDVNIKASFINCVSMKTPKDVHVRLIEDFAPTSKPSHQSSEQFLSHLFMGPKKSTFSYLVILDEIDSLLDADSDVLYSLFDWALAPRSNLILIGIANALDLTDRFLPRLKSRNLKPQLLPFHPYTSKEICQIISSRLRSTLSVKSSAAADFVPFMHPAAIQLCSKKVASQTGDLRKAFNLVRRAIEQVEQDNRAKSAESSPTKRPLGERFNGQTSCPPTPIKSSPLRAELSFTTEVPQLTPENAPRASIAHVARISSAIFNNGFTSRLSGLNLQQKAVLSSLVARESHNAQRDPFTTPSKSAARVPTIKDLFGTYVIMCSRGDGLLQPLKATEFRDVVASLETLGLVHEFGGRASSMLTPTQTPSRKRHSDDRQIVSGVSRKELTGSLTGPGTDLLLRLFDE